MQCGEQSYVCCMHFMVSQKALRCHKLTFPLIPTWPVCSTWCCSFNSPGHDRQAAYQACCNQKCFSLGDHLNWLISVFQMKFKGLVLIYKALKDLGAAYLRTLQLLLCHLTVVVASRMTQAKTVFKKRYLLKWCFLSMSFCFRIHPPFLLRQPKFIHLPDTLIFSLIFARCVG